MTSDSLRRPRPNRRLLDVFAEPGPRQRESLQQSLNGRQHLN